MSPVPSYQTVLLTELPVHGDFLRQLRKKECILIYKEKVEGWVPVIEEKKNFDPVEAHIETKCEEDLIGTPLECPFNLDELKVKDEEFITKELECDSRHASALKTCEYRPFPAFEARKILCSLMQDLPAMPVLCLCDAQDGERTSILGMEKVKRDLIHYKVTINGPVRSTNEKIQLERLKSEMKYLINQDEFSYQTFATYEAYRGTNLSADENKDDTAYVRLECSWKNPTKVLELPHIASQAKVIIHPTPGEKCSGAYGIWRQLNTLHHLVTGLNSMEIVWFPQDCNINLQDEIDKLISAFTQNETDQLKGKMRDDELYTSKLNYKRTPMDFIDHLWELLSQNCSSFSELSQSLKYTYQKAKADHPMVFFDNPTKFGKMLRQNDTHPQFSGMEPVILLIEMGVEKLKRDYLFIFSGNNLVAERVISSFLPQDGAKFEEQLRCLMSVHRAVEVLSLGQGVLKLPHLTLRDIVPSLLDHYHQSGSADGEADQPFAFHLGVCLLKDFFKYQENGSTVEKWMVELTSSSTNPVKMVYQLTATDTVLEADAADGGEKVSSIDRRLYSVERYLCRSHPVAHQWERKH